LDHSKSVKSSSSPGDAATAMPSMRPGSGIKPPSGSGDAKRSRAKAAAHDVRKLVTERRMRKARRLHVHLAAPRLGNVRVRRAHVRALFGVRGEQEHLDVLRSART